MSPGKPRKARTMADIMEVCRPQPLEAGELEVFFVETDVARDPHQQTRQRIARSLETEDTRILLFGHRGCGKSTELNKFIAEQGDRFLPVKFSVLNEMAPNNVRAEDLVLVITERVLSTAKRAGIAVDKDQLQPVLKYFTERTTTKTVTDRTSSSAGGGIGIELGIVDRLLDMFAHIRGEIQHDSYSEDTILAHVRKRPAELLQQANYVINAVRKNMPAGRRFLIVVEDIDKLDLKQAREMFVNNVNLLTGMKTNIIYTIPIFLFHSPDVGSFKPQFDDVFCLPMIKIIDPQGKRTDGFHVAEEIVMRRLENDIIRPEALEKLIEMTGGVLRQAFDVLFTVANMADVKPPITPDQIRYGLDQLKKEFWQQVSLPFEPIPGGPTRVDELYDRLADYARKQIDGKKLPPIADPTNQVLLRSCALIEYNGEGWLGVHPLVIENLKDLGRIT